MSRTRWWRRQRLRVRIVIDSESKVFTDASLCSATSEVTTSEVVQVGRVDGPVVTLTVGRTTCLDETVVEGQVVSNGVTPTWTT